jgi:hypothetical protein
MYRIAMFIKVCEIREPLVFATFQQTGNGRHFSRIIWKHAQGIIKATSHW